MSCLKCFSHDPYVPSDETIEVMIFTPVVLPEVGKVEPGTVLNLCPCLLPKLDKLKIDYDKIEEISTNEPLDQVGEFN